MEIGPYRVNDQKNLVHNNGSWNEFANLLFVDNPVGTGFSYVDTDSYVTELEEMAKQFIQFLEQWFEIFPEYALDDASPLSPSSFPRNTANNFVVVHCWRVLRWTAHPLHHESTPRAKQAKA